MRLTGYVGLIKDINNLPWTSWSPTYSSGTGSLTSVSTTFANYQKVGRIVFFSVEAVITNAGTAGGFFGITTPTGLDPIFSSVAVGREHSSGFNLLMSQIVAGVMYTFRYTGATCIATGRTINVSGWYRVA